MLFVFFACVIILSLNFKYCWFILVPLFANILYKWKNKNDIVNTNTVQTKKELYLQLVQEEKTVLKLKQIGMVANFIRSVGKKYTQKSL